MTKRKPLKSEPEDYEKPSKKISGKTDSKVAVGPFVPKLPSKEERGNTIYAPIEESPDLQPKFVNQEVDFHRENFRDVAGLAHLDPSLVSPPPENALSSYGMYALNRAANAPTSYSNKSGAYNAKSSAFQVFSNMMTDDPNGNLLNMLLTEVRTQTKLSADILEKVDMHNKMLSVLIKDYQLSKYSRKLHRLEKKQTEDQLEPPTSSDTFYNLIGKGPEEILNKKDLYMFLKDPDIEYKYQLELLNEVEIPLVKDRNFQ